jgi:eukaryotic-like serine/threonine-protein kinase
MDPQSLGSVGVRVGELVGGVYRVDRALGAGGMGVVALAMDERLARWVAIKFVSSSTLKLPEMRQRFVDEARRMARLAHPNVLAVYAFGEHGDTPYFVMEYLDGHTAAEWLSDRPAGTQPSPEEVVALLEQACRGVEAIHASRMVHRDLKPSNILIDRNLRAAVGDFGLSCLAGPVSATTVAAGTAAYIAPESAFGDASSLEFARDIYALGCIAYELLVGRPPFVGESAMNVLAKHIVESPVPPSERRPALGTTYDDVILRALAKEASQRHPTVAAFREALVAAHEGTLDPERILVADDDPSWREIIVTFLARRFPNAAIASVADGVAAMDAFRDQPASVVLVDLEMPEMDGTALTRALRATDAARKTAIVVLTAAGGPSEWRSLAALGADAFLVKPIALEDLELVIRRTLRSRRASSLQAS